MIAIFEAKLLTDKSPKIKLFVQPTQSDDYNLSDDSFDPDASQTVDYEQYSLSGQTNSKHLYTRR